MDMNNPLLDFTDLPLFDRIRPEHVGPAVKTLLAQADAALTTVTEVQFPSRWKAISGTLDVATERPRPHNLARRRGAGAASVHDHGHARGRLEKRVGDHGGGEVGAAGRPEGLRPVLVEAHPRRAV